MKILNNYILLSLLFVFNLINAQIKSPNTILIDKHLINDLKIPNIKLNSFLINQSFSLSTSFNNNSTSTSATFSNYTKHNLSEKLKINTAFHLIQNKNNIFQSQQNKMGMGYEIGLEYEMGPNSILSLQILNYNNQNPLNRFLQ